MKITFPKTLSTLALSGLCMMSGGLLSSCKSDNTGAGGMNYNITLNKTDERLALNETLILTPGFSDPKAADLTHGWWSSNLDVATVERKADGTAAVTALAKGWATIKIVSGSNPKLFATCEVEVFARTIGLDKTGETIFKGKTLALTPVFGGDGTDALDYTWTSSDGAIASVVSGENNTAVVKGESAGTATITITCDTNPGLKASCEIEVAAYSITLNPNGGAIRKNGTLEITPAFNNPEAGGFSYTWTSGSTAVATVAPGANNKGVVTGVSDGTATITITCNADPELTASCEVEIATYSVSLDKSDETVGTKTGFVITPAFAPAAAGNLAYTWSSSDTGIATVVKNGNGTATITAVAAGEAIITVKADIDNSITASCKVTVIPAVGPPFVFDKVYIDGTAVAAKTEIAVTLENPNLFAWYGDLVAGTLSIPAESGAETYYVVPADGTAEFATTTEGAVEDAGINETAVSWTIPAAGKYRIVIDRTDKTIAVYSPAIDLQPFIATWFTNDTPPAEMNTEVTDFWMYGGGSGWGWWNGFVPSLADPQVLVCSSRTLTSGDGIKFAVYGETDFRNVSYVFTNPLTESGGRQNITPEQAGYKLWGGYDGETRNSYYKLPGGTNFIVIDLRNMTIYCEKR